MNWRKQLIKWLEPERKKVAVLIDYLNIVLSDEVVVQGKIIDFDILMKECVKFGKVVFPLVFIPDNYRIPSYIHDKGFYPMLCPSKNGSGPQKYKDKVDTIMSEWGWKLIEYANIDVVVIVAHDGDFIRLGNQVVSSGGTLITIAGKKISYLLKQLSDTVLPVPVKDR